MEWRDDLQPARAGDVAARERLREYLTPFAHGVCLAHVAHHVTEQLVPRVLDEVLVNLATVGDLDVGPLVMATARRLAQQVPPTAEQRAPDQAITDARLLVARLRELPLPAREQLFLRLVEGIPGRELAEVARLTPSELRAELERAATDASRLLGQPQTFAGDDYLWEAMGTPPPLFARLELQLPVLRFDPTAAPLPPSTPDTAGTFQELRPVGSVGGLGGPMKKLLFAEEEHTSVGDTTAVGEVSTEPGVAATAPPKPVGPNPFEPQVRTIAATDLPAEAKGQVPLVPWPDDASASSGSKSERQAPLPPRPVPAPRDGEVSGKSGSGKSGRQSVIVEGSGKKVSPESSQSGRQPPMPSRAEVTKDAPRLDEGLPATQARMPAPLAKAAETNPESMLGRPTLELPTSAAVQGETRIQPIPIRALTDEETSTGVVTREPAPPLVHPLLKGASPLFVALPLVLLAVLAGALSLFSAERHSRSAWQLVPVVVAAEDLSFGDVINQDNVALRSVPREFGSASGMVKEDGLPHIMDQRLLADVQAGDPLFWVQFSQINADNNALAKKVLKHARGVSVPVSTVGAVGQLVHPGERVDVIVSITAEDKGPDGKGKGAQAGVRESRSVTILQNVTMIATGKANSALSELALDERQKHFTDVTLLLTPEEAEIVTLATNLGKLHLTLRTEYDDEVDLERGFSNASTLLDGNRRRALQKHRSQVIQIIRTAQPEGKQPLR